MSKTLVTSLYSQSSQTRKLGETIVQSQSNISVSGLIGSSLSMVLAKTFRNSELPFLLILNDKEEAAYHLNDLENLLGDKNVLFYPGSYRRPYQIEEIDNANVLLRSEVLNRINSRKNQRLLLPIQKHFLKKWLLEKNWSETR